MHNDKSEIRKKIPELGEKLNAYGLTNMEEGPLLELIEETRKKLFDIQKKSLNVSNLSDEDESTLLKNKLAQLEQIYVQIQELNNGPLEYSLPIQSSTEAALMQEQYTEVDKAQRSTTSRNDLPVSNSQSIKVEGLRSRFAAIMEMPLCAEKLICLLSVVSHLKLVGEDYIEHDLHKHQLNDFLKTNDLRERLIKEGLLTFEIKGLLEKIEGQLKKNDPKELCAAIDNLLKKICIFNLTEFKYFINQGNNATNEIKDEDITMLFGGTGVGKSTTIHKLAGTVFDKNPDLNYIKPLAIKNDALHKIITGPELAHSQTKVITVVPIDCQQMGGNFKGIIKVCDSPGIGDSGGPEVDAANSINLFEAIQQCRSIKLTILISKKSIGDRGLGLEDLVRFIYNMIKDVDKHLPSFTYWFTNYSPDESKKINDYIAKIIESRRAETHPDERVLTILEDMHRKTCGGATVIIPTEGSPGPLLDELAKVAPIKKPRECFNLSISHTSQSAIQRQAESYRERIIEAVKREEYVLASYQIKQLQWLLSTGFKFIDTTLVTAIDKIGEEINSLKENISALCNHCFADHNALATTDFNKILKLLSNITDIETMLQNSNCKLKELPSEEVEKEIINQATLLIKKSKLTDEEEGVIAARLTKVATLAEKFKDLVPVYKEGCQQISASLLSLVNKGEAEFKDNKFNDLGLTLLRLKQSVKIWGKHISVPLAEGFINTFEGKFLSSLENYLEECDHILTSVTLSDDNVNRIQHIINLLDEAKASLALNQHFDNKKITEYYEKITDKVLDYFKRVGEQIKSDNSGLDTKKHIQQLEKLIATPAIGYKASVEFYTLINTIRQRIELVQKEAENIISELNDAQSERIDVRRLTTTLSRLNDNAWIDSTSPGIYERIKEHIQEELKYRVTQQKQNISQLRLGLNQNDNIAKASVILANLVSLEQVKQYIPEFDKYLKGVWEDVTKPFITMLDKIASKYDLKKTSIENCQEKLSLLTELKRQCDQKSAISLCLKKYNFSDQAAFDNTLAAKQTSLRTREDKVAFNLSQAKKKLVKHQQAMNYKGDDRVQVIRELDCFDEKELEAAINKFESEIDLIETKGDIEVLKLRKEIEELHSIQQELNRAQEVKLTEEQKQLLSLHNLNSIENLEREYKQVINLIQKYQRLNVKNIFIRLDTNDFNSSYHYAENCPKGIGSLDDRAKQTKEILEEYAKAYGEYVDADVKRCFADLLNVDSTTESIEMLQRYFNEFKQISPNPSLLGLFSNDSEIIGSWRRVLYNKVNELGEKLRLAAAMNNVEQLRKLLNRTKVLTWLDSFFEVNHNKFTNLLEIEKNYNQRMNKMNDEIVLKLAANEYDHVSRVLNNFKEATDAEVQAAYTIARGDLIRHIKHKCSEVTTHLNNIEALEENLADKLNSGLARLSEILTALGNHIAPKDFEDFKEFIERAKGIIKEQLEALFEVTYNAINSNDFLTASDRAKVFRKIYTRLRLFCPQTVGQHLDDIELAVSKMSEAVNILYLEMAIAKYPINPPSEISKQLASVGAAARRAFDSIIQQKINDALVQLTTKVNSSSREIKDQLREVELAIPFLPDSLVDWAKQQLSDTKTFVESTRQKYSEDITAACKDDDINKIRDLSKQYEAPELSRWHQEIKKSIALRIQHHCKDIENWAKSNEPLNDAILAALITLYRYSKELTPSVNENYQAKYDYICVRFSEKLSIGFQRILAFVEACSSEDTRSKLVSPSDAIAALDNLKVLLESRVLKTIPPVELGKYNLSTKITSSTKLELLYGKISGKDAEFEEHQVALDGSCGFHTLGADRKKVQDKLLPLSVNESDRNYLREEVQSALMVGDIQPVGNDYQRLYDNQTKIQTEYDALVRKYKNNDITLERLDGPGIYKALAETKKVEAKALDDLHLKVLQAEEELLKYCSRKEVYEQYVKELGKKLWLGYKSAMLYARLEGISLYVWEKNKNQQSLRLIDHYVSAKPTNLIHMLHTNSYTHFNLLSVASPVTKQTSQALNILEVMSMLETRIEQVLTTLASYYRVALDKLIAKDLRLALTILRLAKPFLEKLQIFSNGHFNYSNMQMIAGLSTKVLQTHSEQTILHMINSEFQKLSQINLLNDKTKDYEVHRNQFYKEINDKISGLHELVEMMKFELASPAWIDLQGRETTAITHLANQFLMIMNQANVCFGRQNLKQKDYEEINLYLDNFNSAKEFLTSSSNLSTEIKSHYDKIISDLEDRVTQYSDDAQTKMRDMAGFAENIILLKVMSQSIRLMLPTIDNKINELLKIYKSVHSKDVTAGGKLRLIFENSKTNPVMAQTVLSDHSYFKSHSVAEFYDRTQKQGLPYVMKELKLKDIGGKEIDIQNLDQHFAEFDLLYRTLVRTNLSQQGTSTNIEGIAQAVKAIAKEASDAVPQKSGAVKWADRTIKDIIKLMAHIFAIWTLSKAEYFFDTEENKEIKEESRYLVKPHAAQVIAIFLILGIGYIKKSLYSKTANFVRVPIPPATPDFINTLIQIKTGEGKSVTLAVTACILALFGMDISIACYSDYLSNRDWNDFKSIFEVLGLCDFIHYGTFNVLCERLINERGDIRERVNFLVSGNEAKAQPKKQNNRPAILLIDEVDVFFDSDFYGNIYSPTTVIKHAHIRALTDYIWQNKTKNLTLKTIKGEAIYEECAKTFKNYQKLLDEAIKAMLLDLKDFDKENYVVKDGKIGYEDQDGISFNRANGYRTLFAYYHEHEKDPAKITDTSLQQCVGLYVKCGDFSYAEIPLRFEKIVGVTGTLDTLTKAQKEVIEDKYKIQTYAYMPSVFGKNHLIFHEKADVTIANSDDYFMKIRAEIELRLGGKRNRAVSVYFENTKKARDFYDSQNGADLRDNVQILSEEMSDSEKHLAVKRATTAGKVNYIVRRLGRGVDFIIKDPSVRESGGTHVLKVFLSKEPSEEIQIRGRAARQGDPGSFSMILLDKDLEAFGITPAMCKEMHDNKETYEKCDAKRTELFETQYRNDMKFVTEAKEVHAETVKFIEELDAGKTEVAKHFLVKKNLGPNDAVVSRTIVLMDATISMGQLLNQTKNQVKAMLTRAESVLKEHKMSPDCFQVQFAVYRNYNCQQNKLLEFSRWETDPLKLKEFMAHIENEGGLGNEAIEIGFAHVNQECEQGEVKQVLLIGDAPAQSAQETLSKRSSTLGESYWAGTKFSKATSIDEELKKLVTNKVPVHTFYLEKRAKKNFEFIAQETGGKAAELDVYSSTSDEKLTDIVTEAILKNVGGDAQGDKLVASYREKFKSYTK